MTRPLFVVSDIHGHRDDLVAALQAAGLTDASGHWAGEDARLWVLGDYFDRGPDGVGVVEVLMSLQGQAPESVGALIGNHEPLTLGMHRFGSSRFRHSWQINGGLAADQQRLTEEQVEWLSGLPALAREDDWLLMHSDTQAYLGWGETIDAVNAYVREALTSADEERHWELWAELTSRYEFVLQAPRAASVMLAAYGGERIVHGHTLVGILLGMPSQEVSGPVLYDGGRVLAVDGGRYDGGPLLLVRLDGLLSPEDQEPTSPDS